MQYAEYFPESQAPNANVVNRVDQFFDKFNLGRLVASCEITKSKGNSPKKLLLTLFALPFLGQNLFRGVVPTVHANSARPQFTTFSDHPASVETLASHGGLKVVARIDQTTDLVNKSGEALAAIVSLVDLSSDQVRAIATAAEGQSATTEAISRSIEQINTISAKTSQVMNEAARAVSALAGQAHILQDLIVELQTEAGGGPMPSRFPSGVAQAALPSAKTGDNHKVRRT
jgi:hypothetical protein